MKMTEYIDLINKKIDEFMPICYPQKIFKSMKYTVTLPGKRLRPVMCLETCRMFGGNYEDPNSMCYRDASFTNSYPRRFTLYG